VRASFPTDGCFSNGLDQSNSTNDVLSLQAMRRFKVGEKFGFEEKASFKSLAEACKVNVIDLRRLIRYAMTNHIFREEDGLVAHTAASRLLTENKLINDVVGVATEELFPGAVKVRDDDVSHRVSWRQILTTLSRVDHRCPSDIRWFSCTQSIGSSKI